MFDLEKTIAEWRQQMFKAGVKSPVPLDELESHLREDFERLAKTGMDEGKAFEDASQKVGQARALGNEFKKIGVDLEGWKQKFMGVYFVIFSVVYVAICLYGLCTIEMSAALRASGLMSVLFSTFPIWFAPQAHKHLPLVENKNIRMAMQIVPLLLWTGAAGVFANVILPRMKLTQGQLVVDVLWMMMPVAFISCLGHGLGERARRLKTAVNA